MSTTRPRPQTKSKKTSQKLFIILSLLFQKSGEVKKVDRETWFLLLSMFFFFFKSGLLHWYTKNDNFFYVAWNQVQLNFRVSLILRNSLLFWRRVTYLAHAKSGFCIQVFPKHLFVLLIRCISVSLSVSIIHSKFQYDLAWQIICLRVLISDTNRSSGWKIF